MGDAHYLPQSPLPEVPGRGRAAMARRPRGGAAAGSLLSRRLHPAGVDPRASRSRTRRPSTTSCSGPPPRRSSTIAADPKHLGARIGLTAVLHTWGSTLTHHPHVHVIVPGGGLSPDGSRWIACKPGFFLPVARAVAPVPPPLPRQALRRAARGRPPRLLRRPRARSPTRPPSTPRLAPLRRIQWVVYAKRPFAGPQSRARLSRALHPSRRDLELPARRRSTRRASPSTGRTIGSKAATG